LLSISQYDAAETASWLKEHSWTFPVLCDGGEVIQSYGILNDQLQQQGRGNIPHPTTIIIDREGVVRFINIWIDYKNRTSPEVILQELDKLK
jgi:peroxiredoxin